LARPPAGPAVRREVPAPGIVLQDTLRLPVQDVEVPGRIGREPRREDVPEVVLILLDERAADHGERVRPPRECRAARAGVEPALDAVDGVDHGLDQRRRLARARATGGGDDGRGRRRESYDPPPHTHSSVATNPRWCGARARPPSRPRHWMPTDAERLPAAPDRRPGARAGGAGGVAWMLNVLASGPGAAVPGWELTGWGC